MKLLSRISQSPLWLLAPALGLACMVGAMVMGYEPLMFDPGVLQAQAAQAAGLETVNPDEVGTGKTTGTPAPAGATQAASAPAANQQYADGDWKGYAACGQGNADGWKPYYVEVTVKVSGGKPKGITGIRGTSKNDKGASLNWDAAENQTYLDWAIGGRNGARGVQAQINAQAASGAVSGVDTVSGATYSSVAIYNAYVDALNKSAAAAGNDASKAAAAKTKTKKDKKQSQTVKHETEVGALADGTWTGYAVCGEGNDEDWKPYYVAVRITVKDGAVVSVDEVYGSSTGDEGMPALRWDDAENGLYLAKADYGVGAQISDSIERGKLPSSIDVVSGATYSSEAIFDAFYAALAKSAAAGGSTVEVPKAGDDPAKGDSSGADQSSDEDKGKGAGDDGGESLASGTYYGYALCQSDASTWNSYYIFVEVKATDGAITAISKVYGDADGIVDASYKYAPGPNAIYFDSAVNGIGAGRGYRTKSVVKQIQAYLDAGAAVGNIDTVSGATISSEAIVKAFANAVSNVSAGIGDTPEHAVQKVGPAA